MSSRLKPNVICVRSFVPKLKNSAVRADLVGRQRRPRNLDHRADQDVELALVLLLLLDVGDRLPDLIGQHLQFLGRADERDHDLGLGVDLLLLAGDDGLDDRLHLHLQNLRIRDRQPAAAMAEHRVHLVQLADARLDVGGRDAELLGHLGLALGVVRQELVQRRIEQPDRHRQAVHRREDADEVLALQRQQLLQGRAAVLLVGRQDHRPHRLDPLALEEHVLGAAQADAFGTELAGPLGVGRRVGVRADLQRAILVGPAHHRGEIARELRRLRGDRAGHHFAGRAVDRERVVVRERLAADFDLAGLSRRS